MPPLTERASSVADKATFTPGPWAVCRCDGEVGVQTEIERGVWVATTGLAGHSEPEANAHLIAAAPCLFEALTLMQAEYGWAIAERALAKARGE